MPVSGTAGKWTVIVVVAAAVVVAAVEFDSLALAPEVEQAPPRDVRRMLTDREIAWCVRERLRLGHIRDRYLTTTTRGPLNVAIRDHARRCADARVDAAAWRDAEADAGDDMEALRAAARRRAIAWDAAVRKRIDSDDVAAGLHRLDPTRVADARRIQRHLTALGYDPGPADGKWGPASSAALRQFRRDAGLGGEGWTLAAQRRLFRIPEPEGVPPR